jgi:hypothetical protein
MANKARPEELHALEVGQRVLGVKLLHTDSNGQVDIQSVDSVGSLDGKAAIEVTTVTKQARIATRERMRKTLDQERTAEVQDNTPPALLSTCWCEPLDERPFWNWNRSSAPDVHLNLVLSRGKTLFH